jgi:sedoheptulokinase
MSVVIGVDIGSSAIKAVLYGPENGVKWTKSLAFQVRTPELLSKAPNPGHFEEDPFQLRDQVFEVIQYLATTASQSGQTIAGIAFTGQMHGGLLVDAELNPLTNIITWQDKRGDEMAANGKTYVELLRELVQPDPTGVGIHTGFLAATLYWLMRNNAMPRAAAAMLGIHDWLTSILLGHAVIDITSAAAWGMYDIITHEWKQNVISALGIERNILPDVFEPGTDLGPIENNIAKRLGLPLGTRVHAGIGDTQASYLGSGCGPDEILLNFGTGSQSMWEASSQLRATQGTDIRYLLNNRYIVTVPTLAGGKAYQILSNFFRDVLCEFSDTKIELSEIYPIMDALALKTNSNGIIFDPIFNGSKCRNELERASISGLTPGNFTSGSLVRALIEGMIEEIAKPYFVREGKLRHSGLIGAGNGIRNSAALRGAAEHRFELPLKLSKYEEEAALGAAKLAL